jgi:flagellar protein FlbD
MILLHRIGHGHGEFVLNPDLVCTIEANPDTTISLTTGLKLVVAETVAEVIAEVRSWRAEVMAEALVQTKASRHLVAR